jgi:hypothetical protein
MSLREAAEMALERLESHEYWMDEEAIQALRQALKQEWVGLGHIEIGNLWSKHRSVYEFATAIENLLKERNT